MTAPKGNIRRAASGGSNERTYSMTNTTGAARKNNKKSGLQGVDGNETQQDDAANPERNWFGYTRVDPREKTARVLGVFDNVAGRYDIMNDAMSMGIHRLWKNRLIRDIRPQPHERFLDVAGGTGDIAFRLFEATNRNAAITVCDINANMLEVGRDRALDRGYGNALEWVTGNAEALPFPSATTTTDGFRRV